MGHLIAGSPVRLSYLHAVMEIESLDQAAIVSDLGIGNPDRAAWLDRRALTDYDHVVVGSDRRTGRHIALLGCCDGCVAGEPVLFLDTVAVAGPGCGASVMRRMIALVMLRAVGCGTIPRVLAACTSDPEVYGMLRDLGDLLGPSALFPQPSDQPVTLRSAALARRIARHIAPQRRFETATGAVRGGKAREAWMREGRPALSPDPMIDALFGQRLQEMDEVLTILDLRAQSEDSVTDAARTVFRGR